MVPRDFQYFLQKMTSVLRAWLVSRKVATGPQELFAKYAYLPPKFAMVDSFIRENLSCHVLPFGIFGFVFSGFRHLADACTVSAGEVFLATIEAIFAAVSSPSTEMAIFISLKDKVHTFENLTVATLMF